MAAKRKSAARTATVVDREIGKRIRERRAEIAFSQERLADAIGVTFQQVQKYEKGINRVSASMLFRICEVLDIQVASLVPVTKATALDADIAEFSKMFARLNADGRKRVLELLRSVAKPASKEG